MKQKIYVIKTQDSWFGKDRYTGLIVKAERDGTVSVGTTPTVGLFGVALMELKKALPKEGRERFSAEILEVDCEE